jgi:hypothetical protein
MQSNIREEMVAYINSGTRVAEILHVLVKGAFCSERITSSAAFVCRTVRM